jgi:hypothetical protein
VQQNPEEKEKSQAPLAQSNALKHVAPSGQLTQFPPQPMNTSLGVQKFGV